MESVIYTIERGLSVSRLQELFEYDPELGTITRKIAYGRCLKGFVLTNAHGIKVDGKNHKPNRIAWALYHGSWPPPDMWVDHKNGVKANNSIENLRLATPTQNQQNKAGYGTYSKGVTWRNRIGKPYQAKIRVNGDRIHLGSFATEEEAAEAYKQAALKYHGEFACL